jgi:hypothetical protein
VGKVSDGNEANWERKVLEKLALEALAEQKRGRRWGIFFKLLGFGYLALLLVVHFPGLAVVGEVGHQAFLEDAALELGSSTGKHSSMRRKKLRSIQSALERYIFCAPSA